MPGASPERPRLLLLLPTTTYRADAFVAAAARLDVDLTVGSEVPSSFASRNPSGLLTLDIGRPERAAADALAFHARHPVSGVVGVDDDTVVAAACIAEALGLPHNPRAAAEAARDKHRQRVMLRDAGVRVPGFRLHDLGADVAALARAVTYPCVMKPLTLSASRGVIRADDPGEFRAAHRRLAAILDDAGDARFLVETFVPGREFAVEGLLHGGRFHTLALFDKPDPLDGPFFEETIYVTPSRAGAAHQRAMRDAVAAAATAIGLVRGPVHAEVRVNREGVWLIEVAARPIGGKCGRVLRFGPRGETALEEVVLRHALGWLDGVPAREAAARAVMMIPSPGRGRLRRVEGVEAARAIPGVDDVIVTVHRGETLVPPPEGNRYPGFVFAHADTPAEAEGLVRAAFGQLRFVLEAA